MISSESSEGLNTKDHERNRLDIRILPPPNSPDHNSSQLLLDLMILLPSLPIKYHSQLRWSLKRRLSWLASISPPLLTDLKPALEEL